MFGEDPQSSGRWPNRLSSRVWPSRWNRLLGSFNPISRNFNRRSSNCSEKILKVFLMIQHFLDTGSEAQLCCDSKTMVELDDFSRLNMARLLWKSILQVASLPSPCGRCHRALFHVFWFSVGCWQVRPGKCHANGHGVAWEQGHESWSEKKPQVFALRSLRIEILQVFDLWGLRNFQRGLSRQFDPVQVVWRWCDDCSEVHLFFPFAKDFSDSENLWKQT